MASIDDFAKAVAAGREVPIELSEVFTDLPQAKGASFQIRLDDGRTSLFVARSYRNDADSDSIWNEFKSPALLPFTDVQRHLLDGENWTTTIRVKAANTLKNMLGSRRRPPGDPEMIILRAAEALDELHSEGLVHANLRPSRILWTVEGGWQVSDYLLPGVLTHSVDYIKLADQRYLAPEISSSERGRRFTPASDAYSLGVIASEIAQATSSTRFTYGRRRTQDRLLDVATVCTFKDPLERPTLSNVRLFLGRNDAALLENVTSKDRYQRTYALLRNNFMASLRVHRWYSESQPFEEAFSKAFRTVSELSEMQPGALLALQNETYHVKMLDRLMLNALRGSEINERLLERELRVNERITGFDASRLNPPEIDELWSEEIFADHRRLITSPSAEDIEPADRFEAIEVFDRLQKALAAAGELRRYVLETVPTFTLDDLVALDTSVQSEEVRQMALMGEVVIIKDHGRLLFPMFQFADTDSGISVHSEIALVNALLGDMGTGWMRALWWTEPLRQLGGIAPQALLGTPNSDRIVDAARSVADF